MTNLVVFNGGLMRGQSAHWKLRGATFLEVVQTAPRYRLYSIGDRYPAMLRDESYGTTITAELYDVPEPVWVRVNNIEPPGLYRGPVELADGRWLEGMLGEERFTLKNGTDISRFGSWANYPNRTGTARMDKDPDDLSFDLFVSGPLLRGLAEHTTLRWSPYLGLARTEPRYAMHVVDGRYPAIYRRLDHELDGRSIRGELYRVSEAVWPQIAAELPPGITRAMVTLDDLSQTWGLLADRQLALQHPEITALGDWRAFVAQ